MKLRGLIRDLAEASEIGGPKAGGPMDFWSKWGLAPNDAAKSAPIALAPQSNPQGQPTKPGEKPAEYKPQLKVSAGCVVLPSLHPDDLNFCYVIKPTNNFGPIAFPKGRVDKGETFPEAARRETKEETGIICSILPGGYLGKGTGRVTVTHYFMAVQTGGNLKHDDEVEWVKLVSFEEAWKMFAREGNKRDIEILKKAWKFTDKLRGRSAIRTLPEPQTEPSTRRSGPEHRPR